MTVSKDGALKEKERYVGKDMEEEQERKKARCIVGDTKELHEEDSGCVCG